LTHRGACLSRRQIQWTLLQPDNAHSGGNRTAGNDDALASAANELRHIGSETAKLFVIECVGARPSENAGAKLEENAPGFLVHAELLHKSAHQSAQKQFPILSERNYERDTNIVEPGSAIGFDYYGISIADFTFRFAYAWLSLQIVGAEFCRAEIELYLFDRASEIFREHFGVFEFGDYREAVIGADVHACVRSEPERHAVFHFRLWLLLAVYEKPCRAAGTELARFVGGELVAQVDLPFSNASRELMVSSFNPSKL
jgi:hypothetical protein